MPQPLVHSLAVRLLHSVISYASPHALHARTSYGIYRPTQPPVQSGTHRDTDTARTRKREHLHVFLQYRTPRRTIHALWAHSLPVPCIINPAAAGGHELYRKSEHVRADPSEAWHSQPGMQATAAAGLAVPPSPSALEMLQI